MDSLSSNYLGVGLVDPEKGSVGIFSPTARALSLKGDSMLLSYRQKLGYKFIVGGVDNKLMLAADKPLSLNELEYVRDLEGNSKLKLYRSKNEPSCLYVLRQRIGPHTVAHAKSAFFAFQAYKACGVHVPEVFYFDCSKPSAHLVEGPVLVTEFVEGETLGAFLSKHPDQKEVIYKKIQEGFAVDALLGNWSVLGDDLRNIRIKNGIPYRINASGALFFNTNGSLKKKIQPIWALEDETLSHFNKHATDLWSMRGKLVVHEYTTEAEPCAMNLPHVEKVFGCLDILAIAEQVKFIASNKDKLLSQFPQKLEGSNIAGADRLREIIDKRLLHMKMLTDQAKLMASDGWRLIYIDEMLKHRMCLKLNIKKLLPKHFILSEENIKQNAHSYKGLAPIVSREPFVSEEKLQEAGKALEDFRDELRQYVEYYVGFFLKNDQERFSIQKIYECQGESSFSDVAVAMKAIVFKNLINPATQQPVDFNDFFWHKDTFESIWGRVAKCEREYDLKQGDLEVYLQIMHALTQELLSKSQFAFNDKERNEIKLIRGLHAHKMVDMEGNPLVAEPCDGSGKKVVLDKQFKGSYSGQKIIPKVAVWESNSLYRTIGGDLKSDIGGPFVFFRRFPYHRVVMSTFLEKFGSEWSTEQGEFVAIGFKNEVEEVHFDSEKRSSVVDGYVRRDF